jgi:hypothetical protein
VLLKVNVVASDSGSLFMILSNEKRQFILRRVFSAEGIVFRKYLPTPLINKNANMKNVFEKTRRYTTIEEMF